MSDTVVVIKKPKMRKQGKNHCLLRSGRNKAKGVYAKQFPITERNRLRKRLKHMRKHPRDQQTAKLLT